MSRDLAEPVMVNNYPFSYMKRLDASMFQGAGIHRSCEPDQKRSTMVFLNTLMWCAPQYNIVKITTGEARSYFGGKVAISRR
jgi:hypothetical protein